MPNVPLALWEKMATVVQVAVSETRVPEISIAKARARKKVCRAEVRHSIPSRNYNLLRKWLGLFEVAKHVRQ
jgi:hypothetical protein